MSAGYQWCPTTYQTTSTTLVYLRPQLHSIWSGKHGTIHLVSVQAPTPQQYSYSHFQIFVVPQQRCLKVLLRGFAVHRKPRLLFLNHNYWNRDLANITRNYSVPTSATSDVGLGQSICVTTAQGAAALTSVWPVSWVSANGELQYSTTGPIIPPSGIMQSNVVINNPTVIAAGIPIMWESTDTLVQSWFDHYQSSGSFSTTSSNPNYLTTSPPPTQSVAKSTATNIQTSRASDRGTGKTLSIAILGALSLICIVVLSS
jgi:hypothetical protein